MWEATKSLPFEKKSRVPLSWCALKTAKNNINYNRSNIIHLPFAQCFALAWSISSLTRFNFPSFNFLWGRPSHLPCLEEEARLREGEGLAQGHRAVEWPRPEGAPAGRRGQRSHLPGRCHWDTRAAPSPGLRRGRWRGSRSARACSLRSARDAEASEGSGDGLGGGGAEARLRAGGGGWMPERPLTPAHPNSPPFPNTRSPFSRAAAEPGLGAGEAGGIAEGIPPPPPAARRPHTHVSAGLARIPPAAQRVPAPRRCLHRPVPTPALHRPWRVPAAPAGRFAGLRLLHPGAARRPRRWQAAPAAPNAGEWGLRGSARGLGGAAARRLRAGGDPWRWAEACGALPAPTSPPLCRPLSLSSSLPLRADASAFLWVVLVSFLSP